MKDRIFQRNDWICAGISTLISFAVYWWTCAPAVTLLDSGEFALAAQHFGVPHPTGYPLWTLLAWLFQLLPIGNAAHEIALFSGVCGALAVGLCTLLIRNSVMWMRPDREDGWLASITSIAVGLMFAFSFSMWSQAVIIEVYTLHALLIGLLLLSLYVWIRQPQRLHGLFWSFFALSLAFSNHQLTLAIAIVPLLVLLLRRDLFWDVFLACAISALMAYLAFAWLANDPLVARASLRLAYLVAAVFLLAVILKRGRLKWTIVGFLPIVLALGLLPYAYLPLASSTNPPMNWGYTRTVEGFYNSFNRSQYPGSLSDQSLRLLSKVTGVAKKETPSRAPEKSSLAELQKWSGFLWQHLIRSFTPLCLVFFFAAMAGMLRLPLAARVWMYVLIFAFSLAAFLQPMLDEARIDLNGWWLQMPYHSYTNLVFALILGIGATALLRAMNDRVPRLSAISWVVLLLPLWPFFRNLDEASQRDRWFGWQFGHDMLADLPKGSVVFGGTDPGRFIPTYLILGESSQPRRDRIDPDFDRRDLYILTQNALADSSYMAYVRDQYGPERPRVKNDFERWLGRQSAYPDTPLKLPSTDETKAIARKAADQLRARRETGETLTPLDTSMFIHGAIAEWIFEHNKADHEFFVEEGYPLEWSYPNAVPHGLVYRIAPEPVASLSPEIVRRDFVFWTDYITRLLKNPRFPGDYDARRSFSQLRITGARLYEYRKMNREAEAAYRQALALAPNSSNALLALSRLLWARGEFDEPINLIEAGLVVDPNNPHLRDAAALAVERRELEAEISASRQELEKNPESLDVLKNLVVLLSRAGEPAQADQVLAEADTRLGKKTDYLSLRISIAESRKDLTPSIPFALRWTEIEPQNPEPFYRAGRALYAAGKRDEAVALLERSFALGGALFRERLFRDPVFANAKDDPAVAKLMVAPTSAP